MPQRIPISEAEAVKLALEVASVKAQAQGLIRQIRLDLDRLEDTVKGSAVNMRSGLNQLEQTVETLPDETYIEEAEPWKTRGTRRYRQSLGKEGSQDELANLDREVNKGYQEYQESQVHKVVSEIQGTQGRPVLPESEEQPENRDSPG